MPRYCNVYTPNITCPPFNITYPPLSVGYSQLEYITECYLVIFIGVFGLIGNTVSIIILHKDKERRELLFLLQILAVADSFYLITCLLRYPMKYFVDINIYYMMQLYVFPIMKIAQSAAVWAMLLVTVDRYIYICRPLHARQTFSHRGRRLMSIMVFAFAFIYNLPRFFDNCLMAIVDKCTNTRIVTMVYSPTFNEGNVYLNVYIYGMYIIFLYLGPLLTLIVLNSRLIAAIRKSRIRHQRCSINDKQNLENQRNSETNATMILVIIIIIFIICETPELIIKLLALLNRHLDFISKESPIFNTFSTISTLLLVTNSAVNFIVYLAYGKRFRRILSQMLGCSRLCPRLVIHRFCCGESGDPSESIKLEVHKPREEWGHNGNLAHNNLLVTNTDHVSAY